jgi:hypothetical protein
VGVAVDGELPEEGVVELLLGNLVERVADEGRQVFPEGQPGRPGGAPRLGVRLAPQLVDLVLGREVLGLDSALKIASALSGVATPASFCFEMIRGRRCPA